MNYLTFTITPPQYSEEMMEILTAILGDLPFDTFEEADEKLMAYMPEKDFTPEVAAELEANAEQFGFTHTHIRVEAQNWNALWESNFQPIFVEGFVGVRADFHPPTENVQFDLLINPKMAFGTGHHETTYMCMQQMQNMDFAGKNVLDYGCGTGILAILASKLGAKHIEAVDIEEWSFVNTQENSSVNDVHNVQAWCGTLETVPQVKYDIILANINRNVILDSLPRLKALLTEGGVLLTSGYLEQDLDIMEAAIKNEGFRIEKTMQRGKWVSQLIFG